MQRKKPYETDFPENYDSYDNGDASAAKNMAEQLLEECIYVTGFSYPVVPKDTARIRIQISAAHEIEDLDKAISAFRKVKSSSFE